jgi:hypothetical protein
MGLNFDGMFSTLVQSLKGDFMPWHAQRNTFKGDTLHQSEVFRKSSGYGYHKEERGKQLLTYLSGRVHFLDSLSTL